MYQYHLVIVYIGAFTLHTSFDTIHMHLQYKASRKLLRAVNLISEGLL